MNLLFTLLSAIYVLFLPGFVLSFVFFGHKSIDLLERIALSFALSISVVPLLVFYLNLMGIKISRVSVAFEVLVVILCGLTYLYVQYLRRKRNAR